MVDEMPFSEWGNDDRRNACPWPPAVDFWGRDMVPNAAVTGIGHDDNRIVPNKALLDFVNNERGVLVTPSDIRVARMLVIQSRPACKSLPQEAFCP